MSQYHRLNGEPFPKTEYKDGRTKQAFKDQTDINKLLKKAQRTGTLSHLEKFGGQYGDFSDFDFHEAQNQLARAREIFDALPSEIRREFGQNPTNFFEFANQPENVGRMAEILPAVAEPGNYFPTVSKTAKTEAIQPQESEKQVSQEEVTQTPPKDTGTE